MMGGRMMGGGMMGRQDRGAGAAIMVRMMFSLMDADGDGSISLQEFQAAHERKPVRWRTGAFGGDETTRFH